MHVAVSTNDLPLLLISVKLMLCEHDAEAAGAAGATSSSSSLTLAEELKDLGTRYGALPFQHEGGGYCLFTAVTFCKNFDRCEVLRWSVRGS